MTCQKPVLFTRSAVTCPATEHHRWWPVPNFAAWWQRHTCVNWTTCQDSSSTTESQSRDWHPTITSPFHHATWWYDDNIIMLVVHVLFSKWVDIVRVFVGTPSLKSYRTATTLCVPDLVFNDISRHKILLPEGTPVQREILTGISSIVEQFYVVGWTAVLFLLFLYIINSLHLYLDHRVLHFWTFWLEQPATYPACIVNYTGTVPPEQIKTILLCFAYRTWSAIFVTV